MRVCVCCVCLCVCLCGIFVCWVGLCGVDELCLFVSGLRVCFVCVLCDVCFCV